LYYDSCDGDPIKCPVITEIRSRLDSIKITIDQVDHNCDLSNKIDSTPIKTSIQ
ncbi:8415_t:CDS:1, partial [Gigaspora rosea]